LIEPAIPEIKKNISKDHKHIDYIQVYNHIEIIKNLVKDTCGIPYKNDNKENNALSL
jgi:hypothetical protein